MKELGRLRRESIDLLHDLEKWSRNTNLGGRYDVNRDAEEFYRGLLNEFYGWNLVNLNETHGENAPGVDLGDSNRKIAVQITSENSAEKVHESIRNFVKYWIPKGYSTLYIFMFQGKPSFPNVNFAKTTAKKFNFRKQEHILDNSDLSKKIKNMDLESLKTILTYLKSNLGSTELWLPAKRLNLPSSSFPSRTLYFTGQDKVLESLSQAVSSSGNISINGVHGIGKSSLVTEFIYRHRQNYSVCIFMTATVASLESSLTEVLTDLEVQNSEKLNLSEKIQEFKAWLLRSNKWLVVFDNIEDIEGLRRWNLPVANGHMIYISNSSNVHELGHKLNFSEMETEDAALLLFRLKEQTGATEIPTQSKEACFSIAAKFGNSPLAMNWVGKYLFRLQKSYAEFIDKYNEKEAELFNHFPFLNDYQHRDVAAAFLATFDGLTKPKNNSFEEVLISEIVRDYFEVSIFMVPDQMPEVILQGYIEQKHPQQIVTLRDGEFVDRAKARLFESSFIERIGDTKILKTHRLVQEIMRLRLKNELNDALIMLSRTIDNLLPVFNFPEREKYSRLQPSLDFIARTIYTEVRKFRKSIVAVEPSVRSLFFKLGRYYRLHYHTEAAIAFNNLSMKLHRRFAEPNSRENYFETMQNQAVCYIQNGEMPKAERLLFKVIDSQQNDMFDSALYLLALLNLSNIYIENEKFPEAEKLLVSCIKVYRNSSGGGYRVELMMAENNLAILYERTNRLEKAKLLYMKILEEGEQPFRDDPSLALIYVNLSACLIAQDSKESALLYLEKSFHLYNRIYGLRHEYTSRTYRELIRLLLEEKKADLLKAIYRRLAEECDFSDLRQATYFHSLTSQLLSDLGEKELLDDFNYVFGEAFKQQKST